MRRAERLFRLVQEMRMRGVCRAEDLAVSFEVSVRTIYRDIAHLQGSGLPIEGEAGVGYLLRPGFDLPAMTFTHEQVDALAVALAFVEVAGDPSLAEAAREVRAKLQASLPEAEQRVLAAAPLFASWRSGPAGHATKLVREAIRARHRLDLTYRDEGGNASRRRVQPLALWAFSDGWLFAGWCELREDFRAFRIDRIVEVVDSGFAFHDRVDRNLSALLASRTFDGQVPHSILSR